MRLALAAVLLLSSAVPAAAQVKLEFRGGLVNLTAQNVPLRTVLAEWSRLGGTKIINAERVTGAPVTIELTGVTERQALDILLRGVPGYMVAARQTAGAGPSSFDRILILATTSAPRAGATAPPSFASSGPPPPPPPQGPDNDGPDDGGVVVVGGGSQPRPVNVRNLPGSVEVQRDAPAQNGVRSGVVSGDEQPPPPAPSQSPFGVQSGTVRPGVVVPPPPRDANK